jgi:hypothetical protein
MKKQLMTLVATVAFAGSVFGQGQVTVANNATSLVRIDDPVAGTAVPVGSISFQLYFAAGNNQPAGSLNPVGPIFPTSAVAAGRMANTVVDIPTAVVPAGGAATFQIWAWTSSFASYDAAFNGGGLIGKSITFNGTTSVGGPPPPLPVSLAGLYPGFAVTAVPEPSTFVLAGLGIASLLLFRRRK